MVEIDSVEVSTTTCRVGSSGKVSHTQATDTDRSPSSVMPPANQTRDLATSLRHAVVAGEPLWCAPDEGSRPTPAGNLAKKQTRSSSYHLGTAFAWPVGLFVQTGSYLCHHKSATTLPLDSLSIQAARLFPQFTYEVSHRHRDAASRRAAQKNS